VDLTQLRAFVTVAQEGNLTRAAERLHLTQPAVSLQIKSLQAELKLQLFARTPTGMALTEDGAKLLPYAEKVMASVAELRQGADALLTTLSGKLAIGTILDPEFTRLGAFLKRLVETYPQLSTELQHGMSGWVLQQVKNGALDVGYYLGTPGREFHSLTLTSFTYSVVAPQGWKSRVAGKDWPALARLPWIWTPPESAHHRLLTKIFAQYKVEPNTVALVDQEPSMLDLVKSGVGLSLVRESIALREAHAHGLVIADAVSLSTELSFITLAKRKNEAMIAAVFNLLNNLWQS
jgi:DNA-binding transcriptional LysR family regulator